MHLKTIYQVMSFLGLSVLGSTSSFAHDPIFGLGPHVVFKEGLEIAANIAANKAANDKEQELAAEFTYGLTGDWAIGADLPYAFKESAGQSSRGTADIALFSKYRFWRQDSLGLQESAAIFIKVITDSAEKNKSPALNKETTDTILGIAYGYESRKNYRWASLRYRLNGTNNAGIDRGDILLIDLVGGIRPNQSNYIEADTVWLLELNGELAQAATLNGKTLANSGGNQWFVSPGLFWTKRNFAIKAGMQIPLISQLNGAQEKTDYRIKTTFEWHL